jgi:hypothetical protein
MLALSFSFPTKIRLTCLHHVPLFKFIEQFQPFNPNQQTSQMNIFTRILKKESSFPMQSVEKETRWIDREQEKKHPLYPTRNKKL